MAEPPDSAGRAARAAPAAPAPLPSPLPPPSAPEDVRDASALWRALRAADIDSATRLLVASRGAALREPVRLSILEDVLPLALQSLAET
jgi:hypothetical protein